MKRILEFKFGTEQFEQELSEWETLKTEYETLAETALPDSMLVTTLLSRTTGTLRQHLKINVRLLDTYDATKNVITEYHPSRHVTGFESLSDISPAPMDIGSMWQGKEMRDERSEGSDWKGKGRGKSPLGPLTGKGKSKGKSKGKRWFPLGKGKGKSKGGKGARIEKRKNSRPRCWICGRHGHLEKGCRNVAAVTEENEEACDDRTDDVTEYRSKDWTNWTGSRTDDWSYSSDYDCDRNDSWTWSTGSDSSSTSVLSQPQRPIASNCTAESSNSFISAQSGTALTPNVSVPHSTVSVTDLETGETITHTPSRRTGSLTRPLHTGTGLLSTLVLSLLF